MRGEYRYSAKGQAFASERFTCTQGHDTPWMLRSHVAGPDVGLYVTMELRLTADWQPIHLALSCEYLGQKGTADYAFSSSQIVAKVRHENLQRLWRANVADPYVVMPHPICAYHQFVRYAGISEARVLICWVDVFDPSTFLRPRLRKVTVRSSDRMYHQTTPAGTFHNLRHVVICDESDRSSLSGEGYFNSQGIPISWRQPADDSSYVMVSYKDDV